jgi:hypothetical protein
MTHLKHLTGALAVGRRDERGVDILEAVPGEELVSGICEGRADASDAPDQIGSGSEVRDVA